MTKNRIALVSDLHLEFADVDLPNTNDADILILSGDIMLSCVLHKYPDYFPNNKDTVIRTGDRAEWALRFRSFLDRVSSQYENIIYISGNHEFYGGKWYQSHETLKQECSRYNNIHYLEDDVVIIGDYSYIGCTLWTDLNRQDPVTEWTVKESMNDYRVILNENSGYSKIKPHHTLKKHMDSVRFISSTIEQNPEKKYVVVGHHAPSHLSIHEKFRNDKHTNGAYCSDLSNFILDHSQIKLWTCGHVHHAHWYYMGDTLVACNPRGYRNDIGVGENTGWNSQFVIDLDSMPDRQHVSDNYDNLF